MQSLCKIGEPRAKPLSTGFFSTLNIRRCDRAAWTSFLILYSLRAVAGMQNFLTTASGGWIVELSRDWDASQSLAISHFPQRT